MKVAALQLISNDDLESNLASIEQLLAQAHAQDVQLAILPENFAFMGPHESDKLRVAEAYGEGYVQNKLSAWARQYSIWIIAGTFPIKSHDPSRVYASSLVYSPQGECVARYDKIHLFDVAIPGEKQLSYVESDSVMPGEQPCCVELPFAKVGLSVCYDLRFAELYRYYAEQGCDILVAPAAFLARTGAAHWEVLVRARAIENQCYMIAPNQGGQHQGGREDYGHSMIVDPWGKILATCDTGEQLLIAEFDRVYLQEVRSSFPALQHRKLR